MSKIACIMMQKNEDLLLELWILYHGYLFGFENLYIFDNGSTTPDVPRILAFYEGIGVNIFRDNNTPKDFDLKGWVVGDLIKSLQHTADYDFFLPLDCDEFVAIAGPHGFSSSRREILSYFEKAKGVNRVLRVTHSLVNVPGSIDAFGIVDHYKSIIPAGRFRFLDHGFHAAELLISGAASIPSDIVHVHMHNKPFPMLLEHAKDKLRPFVDVDDIEAIRNFEGVGNHLKPYFFGYESNYYRLFAQMSRLRFTGLKTFADALRLSYFEPRWAEGAPRDLEETKANLVVDPRFTAAGYEGANPDVANSDMNSVLHYYIFGHREGRPTSVAA